MKGLSLVVARRKEQIWAMQDSAYEKQGLVTGLIVINEWEEGKTLLRVWAQGVMVGDGDD